VEVIHSQLTDIEAVERMRPIVLDSPKAAKAARAHVTEARNNGGYIADRGYRVLTAAIAGTPPAPIAPQNVELFERERELGLTPLEDAFEQLAAIVPELRELKEHATARAELPRDSERELPIDRTFTNEVIGLADLCSKHPDPLVRSALAAGIVLRYIAVLEDQPNLRELRRPFFELAGPNGGESSDAH
jgi:hypothetical protein